MCNTCHRPPLPPNSTHIHTHIHIPPHVLKCRLQVFSKSSYVRLWKKKEKRKKQSYELSTNCQTYMGGLSTFGTLLYFLNILFHKADHRLWANDHIEASILSRSHLLALKRISFLLVQMIHNANTHRKCQSFRNLWRRIGNLPPKIWCKQVIGDHAPFHETKKIHHIWKTLSNNLCLHTIPKFKSIIGS